MDEYIKYRGQDIKLGTCVDLYYTRLDQLKEAHGEMEKLGGNLEANAYLDAKLGWRYRFPFPDEDNIPIGEFKEYNKSLIISLDYDDISLLDFDHVEMWKSCSPLGGGYNVNVNFPCPQSKEFKTVKHSPMVWHIVAIKQQKQIDDEIWTVIGCPYCEAGARLDRNDALKLIHSIMTRYIEVRGATDENKAYYTKVCNRILAGYKTPVLS